MKDRALALLAFTAVSGAALAQTAVWARRATATTPTPQSNAAMAFDAVRNRIVLLGSESGANDTWEFDGNEWTRHITVTRPPRTSGGGNGDWYHAAAFDTVRRVVVLVASRPNVGTETWEWNGSAWTQRNPSTAPYARHRFAVAFDSRRGVLVFFGGYDNPAHSDTWEWDGTTWRQRGTGGPPGRGGHAMVFDSQRNVTVLFGGEGRYGPLNDTWEWDGVSWREHFGIAAPPARTRHQMAFDPLRGRTILFSGNNLQGGNLVDTWEWDGTAWTRVFPTTSPPATFDGVMAFDSRRNAAVLWNGSTWEYAQVTPVTASYTPFGTGCPHSGGTPLLLAMGGSRPRLGSALQLQLSGAPVSIFSVSFGTIGHSNSQWGPDPLPRDLTALGMPGCTAWMAPFVSYALPTALGGAHWNIAVPNNLGLLGLQFYTQCVVTAPGVNQAGLLVSNAGHGIVGSQ